MMKRLALLFLSFAVAAILLPAGSEATVATSALDTDPEQVAIDRALDAASAGGAVASSGAHSSRWKRPRQMSYFTAQSQARNSARSIYLDPKFAFDDYGTGRCLRNSRTMMRCYTWVSEDYYDEYGYYDDTMLCDWLTVSYYQWTGRLVIKTTTPEGVWLSEV